MDKEKGAVFLQKDHYRAHVNPVTKEVQTKYEHLKGTAYLVEKNCPLEIMRNLAKVTVLLHDCGKLSDEFYSYMGEILEYGEKAWKRTVDHSSAGGRIVRRIARRSILAEMAAGAIYSHHGLQDFINMYSGETLFEKRSKAGIDLETIEKRYFEIVDKKILVEYMKDAYADTIKLLARIQDFIKKTEGQHCGCREFYLGMHERLLLSILIDSDWTDTACFYQGESLPEERTEEEVQKIWENALWHFQKYRKHLSERKKTSPLDVYRNEISELCWQASQKTKALYRLTVPTGGGKTLSSLWFALNHAKKYHKQHIFYVAPYTSILEQNAEEIRNTVGKEVYVLEHHCNVFYEEISKEKTYQKLSENWKCPIVATTAVQMLNTLFSSQKSSIRRMYNLCNSIIIFDEVQAFPIRGTELFNLAVNFLTEFCNTTVVLCSATQPSLATLEENNLFNCTEMVGAAQKYADVFKRVEIEDWTGRVPGGMQPEELSEFALQEIREYGSVLIIVNTKACAKKVYRELKRTCGDECELYHLSTNMCPQNRMEELESIRKDLGKKPVICVSTQLVEAGVDLSFGCVIRSLAGLDSIIQAAGRCNRHKDLERGKVYIVKMAQDAERLDKLEEIRQAGEATEKLLAAFRNAPEKFGKSLDSAEAVKAFYEIRLKGPGIRPTRYPSKSIPETTLEELLGKNEKGYLQYKRQHRSMEKIPLLKQAFRTAGDEYRVIQEDDKVTIVVPYDEKAREAIDSLESGRRVLEEQKNAIRILQRYSVGISQKRLERLGRAVHKTEDTDILVLSLDYYDKKEGVLDEPRNRFSDFQEVRQWKNTETR